MNNKFRPIFLMVLVMLLGVSQVAGAKALRQPNRPPSSPSLTPPLTSSTQPQIPGSSIIDVPLDIVLVQDETGSMGDDISALVSLAPDIWDGIAAITTSEFRMAVVGFRDFARAPWGSSGDFVYRRLSDLTSSRTQFMAGVNQLTADGGADDPEAQYGTLSYLLTPTHACIDSNGNGTCSDSNDTLAGRQPNFRSGATRVILLATDASAHEPLDTSGYPGPSKDAVIQSLTNNRTILIGLVPGGPGAVHDVDQLAQATGGSVQSTGATGTQIADAILAALGEIQPVSAELTTVEVLPATEVADGISPVDVFVTVRDTAGQPVPGRTVILNTNRPGIDEVIQPASVTDENGVTTGQIKSIEPGDSRVVATDAIDSVTFTHQPQITFIGQTLPPNEALTASINLLHLNSTNSLNRISDIADQTADSGERLRDKVTEDAVEFVSGIVFGFIGMADTITEAAKPAFSLSYSGVMMEEGLGWSRIAWLKEYAFTPGALFNSTFRSVIQDGDWASLAIPTLIDGLPFYASMFLNESVEAIQQSVVEEIVAQFVRAPGGFNDLAEYTAEAVDGLNDALTIQRDEVLSGIPIMSDAQQQEYADELRNRSLIPLHYGHLLWRQQFMMDNLESASDSINTGGIELFLLKFAAKAIATAAFDGGGSLLVEGYTTSMDNYLNGRKLEASARAYALAPSILKATIELPQRIYLNQATGLERVTNGLSPHPVVGRIMSAVHYSLGDSWGDFWKENLAYSDVTIVNDTSVRSTLVLITEYDYEDKLFGLPFARIPLTDMQAFDLNSGQSRTVRVWYKNEEEGGVPLDHSFVNFILLGVNDTGTFEADYLSTLWEPVALALSRGRKEVTLPADIEKVENPIDLYVLGGEGDAQYDAKLMVANPFTGTITTTISLPLPERAVVVATDGIVSDGSITWQKVIGASDVVSAEAKIEYSDSQPGESLSLDAATLSFLEPGSGDSLATTSNEAEFLGAWPVDIQGAVPAVAAGTSVSMPVTVTNLVENPTSVAVQLKIKNGDLSIHESTQTTTVAASSQKLVYFSIPSTLTSGWYTMELWGAVDGASRRFDSEAFQVSSGSGFQSLFLPTVLSNYGAAPTQPLVNGDFEQGPFVGWEEYSSNGWAIVSNAADMADSLLPLPSGQWAAWLGGDHYEISYVQQEVTIPTHLPYLTYSHFIASEDICGYDLGGVLIDDVVIDVYDLCVTSAAWSLRSVDLSAYRGQTVMIQFRVETDGSLFSSLYVDDVHFSAGPATAQPPAAPAPGANGAAARRVVDQPPGLPTASEPRRLGE